MKIPMISCRAQKLQIHERTALQISSRVGKLFCKNAGDRILILGKAVICLEGFIRFC
jgi:hypothetical protein